VLRKMNRLPLLLAFLLLSAWDAAVAASLDAAEVNGAAYEAGEPHDPTPALLVKLQILLDRSDTSPGVIDGRMGENVKLALSAFEARSRLPVDGRLDADVWELLNRNAPEAVIAYQLSADDVKGPFAEAIPDDFADLAKLKRLSYTSPAELLAEKFHMHIELLKALNPGAEFEREGQSIIVANVLSAKPDGEVASIEVDKGLGAVRGYGPDGTLLVAYPASIGSDDNPTPAGTMSVRTIVENPEYAYRPDKNFKQADNDQPLDLPPGPNSPVGSIWIDLTKDTYGIHGTPDPELIGKQASHGCVRLTNWDVEELASLVKPGTRVKFLD
jgi:lipoprotein-anchoring transpeptidase ErfK/SrfK